MRNGQSGNYYARVKVNGKEKWRTLKTKVFSVAKLKLGDVERDERSKGMVAAAETLPQGGETTVERFINIYLVRTKNDPALRPATKVRRQSHPENLARPSASRCPPGHAHGLPALGRLSAPRGNRVRRAEGQDHPEGNVGVGVQQMRRYAADHLRDRS
jgi:hypothetical protein